MKSVSNLSILIVGLGSIGMRHAKNFQTLGVDLLVGFDPTLERRQQFVQEIGAHTVSSLDEGLGRGPDLVVIASPNCFHLKQALAAARQGCNLFVEKPISHTLEGVDELVDLVNEQSLYLHVGSNWKFHPAFMTMKQVIESGVLGTITGAQVLSGQWLPDWHPWEDYRQMYSSKKQLAGGIVLDSHEFDYLTWLLGPVKNVAGFSAHTGALDIETEDVAAACLQLESGVIATVHVDYIQREYRRRYHISGDQGTMEWDYTKGMLSLYDANTKETQEIDVTATDLNEMYLEQARRILAGVLGEEAPITPAASALRVLEILCSIKVVESK